MSGIFLLYRCGIGCEEAAFSAAQSGRRILYEAGLWTQLRRAPQEVSSLGCTWGVYVEGADGVHAAQLLRAWSSPVSGAYRVHPNGFLEKAQL